MPLHESESIVMKSYNLAEADRIVVFFTRDFGLLRGVAKGAKRLKSKFGSTLEPFSIVNIEFFLKEERELVSIQHAELIRSSFDIASDPQFLQTFSYLADLVVNIAPPNDPNETLFRMIKACLETSLADETDLASVQVYFEVWMLRLGGYLPDWSSCHRCSRKISVVETIDLDLDYYLLCGSCSRGRGGTKIAPLYRELIRSAQIMAPPEFLQFAAEHKEAVQELSAILKRMIVRSTGNERPIERAFTLRG